jgi:hypothetical protein
MRKIDKKTWNKQFQSKRCEGFASWKEDVYVDDYFIYKKTNTLTKLIITALFPLCIIIGVFLEGLIVPFKKYPKDLMRMWRQKYSDKILLKETCKKNVYKK